MASETSYNGHASHDDILRSQSKVNSEASKKSVHVSDENGRSDHTTVPAGFCSLPTLAISIVMLLVALSVNMVVLVTTQYVYFRIEKQLFPNETVISNENETVCGEDKNSTYYKHKTMAQEDSANFLLISSIFTYTPAIFTNTIFGSLSDRYGRKKMLLVNTSFALVRAILVCFLVYFDMNIYYLYPMAFIDSLGGGFYGAISIGYAYVADITSMGGSPRTIMITVAEISLGIGAIISGASSGYILDAFGYFYTSVFIFGAYLLCILTVLFLLPEYVPYNHGKKASVLQNIKNAFTFYLRDTSAEGKRWKYVICMLIFIAVSFSTLGKPEIEPLYQLNVPFCWSPVFIGWFSSAFTAARNLIGMGSIKILKGCLQETSIAVLGVVSNILSTIMEAFAFNDTTYFIVPVLGVYSLAAFPILRSIMSRMTPPDKQGICSNKYN